MSDAKSSETALAPSLARVRLLMLISAVTTAVAIAAVIGVIGYRVYHAGESGAATITNGTVFLPKGAHVVSTTIGDGRIVVTLDIGGPARSAFSTSRHCSRPGLCTSPPRRKREEVISCNLDATIS